MSLENVFEVEILLDSRAEPPKNNPRVSSLRSKEVSRLDSDFDLVNTNDHLSQSLLEYQNHQATGLVGRNRT